MKGSIFPINSGKTIKETYRFLKPKFQPIYLYIVIKNKVNKTIMADYVRKTIKK